MALKIVIVIKYNSKFIKNNNFSKPHKNFVIHTSDSLI